MSESIILKLSLVITTFKRYDKFLQYNLPKFLKNKPFSIKIHPIDQYRFNIFWKAGEVCLEKYPYLELKQFGKEILLINK